MSEVFVFGLIGASDLNIGGSTFSVTLPDGTVVAMNQIGSHTLLDGLRNALQNGCAGDGGTDDGPALSTLANTTLSAGGIIYLARPASSYRIATSIAFPSNVMLLFCPGATLNINAGITVTMNGTIIAPGSELFSGAGVVVFGSGATRSTKTIIAASSTASGADSYLPKPGDTAISISVPKFSTIRSIRLVVVDAHPSDGNNVTYLVKDGSAAVTYISQTQNSGDPATTVDYESELTLPHVTGNNAIFLLSATGTDTVRYKGWVEVEFY